MTQTQSSADARTRSFTWTDPAAQLTLAAGRNGLELLQAMSCGELPPPPVIELVGVETFLADEGRITVVLRPQEFHYNTLGSVHGGMLSPVLDTAAGCAVHSTLPAGVGYTSLDLNVKFLRPATIASGLLTTVGTVLQRGRRTALAEARTTDEAGKLIAHATSSCMIFEPARS